MICAVRAGAQPHLIGHRRPPAPAASHHCILLAHPPRDLFGDTDGSRPGSRPRPQQLEQRAATS
jgi:hypothetical protein